MDLFSLLIAHSHLNYKLTRQFYIIDLIFWIGVWTTKSQPGQIASTPASFALIQSTTATITQMQEDAIPRLTEELEATRAHAAELQRRLSACYVALVAAPDLRV